MNFTKTKEYLVCIDSEGCAIDTMTIKHQKCFGPMIIQTWELEKFQDIILKRWDEINLFSVTRGINRFKGLAKMLIEIDEKYTPIDGLDDYIDWIDTTNQFSNEGLQHYSKTNYSICIEKVLEWSINVNKSVNNIDDSLKVSYKGCYEAIEKIKEFADIAVVSSANRNVIEKEWEQNNLLQFVDGVLAQDVGTKSNCLQQLLTLGYDKNKVIKIGDALGDLEIALTNEVYFYPILVNNETESWNEFKDIGLNKLLNNDYDEFGETKEDAFYNQFKEE